MSTATAILDALETALRDITIANGYRTDAGCLVYRNMEYSTGTEARPFLVVFPGDNKTSFEDAVDDEQNHLFTIKVEGVTDDDERGTCGALLSADLAQRLWQDRTFGQLTLGYADGVSIDQIVEAGGDNGFVSSVLATFTVLYPTAVGGI